MGLKDSKYGSGLDYSVSALSRSVTRIAEEEFRSVGLAPTYAYLLMTVNDDPGIRPSEISGELALSPSTVTRLVEKMEHRGYLERVSEGRATRVEPTRKSRELDARLHAAWERLQDRFRDELGDRYCDVLAEMSFKAFEVLGKEE